ncbi:MAG: glycosyltransferase family 39 protein [Anaerolineae bacterium]|nr:glycosyltransferase family 39 protein [Anaerolineae bacterium]
MPLTSGKTSHPIWLIICVVLLLLTAVATILRLTNQAYWFDEVFTILFSGGGIYRRIPPSEILSRVASDVWPPLYNLLIAGWGGILGWSEFSLRVFSLFTGLIGIAIVYRLGSEAKSPRVGVLLALLLATCPFYLSYFTEARAYTLYFTLTAASLWLYWHIPALKKIKRLYALVFLLTLSALFYTHYIGLATGGALGIYHLLIARQDPLWRRHWNKTLLLMLLSVLVFSPWLVVAIISAIRESADRRGMDALSIVYWSLYGFGNGLLPYSLAMLSLAIWRIRGRTINFAWFLLIVTLLIALAFNLYADFLFHIRHIIVILPPFLLIIALVLDMLWVRVRWAAVLGMTIWVVAGIYGYVMPDFINGLPGQVEKLPRSFIINAVNTLKSCADTNDVAVFALSLPEKEWLNDRVLQYYLHEVSIPYAQVKSMANIGSPPVVDGTNPQIVTPPPDDYNQRVQEFVGSAQQVWLFSLDTNGASALIEQFTDALSPMPDVQVLKNRTGC